MKMGSPYVVGRFGIAVFYIAKTRFSTQYLPHKGNHVKNVYQQDQGKPNKNKDKANINFWVKTTFFQFIFVTLQPNILITKKTRL